MKIPEKYFKIPRAYLQKSIKMGWGCCYVSSNNPPNAGASSIHGKGSVSNMSYIESQMDTFINNQEFNNEDENDPE